MAIIGYKIPGQRCFSLSGYGSTMIEQPTKGSGNGDERGLTDGLHISERHIKLACKISASCDICAYAQMCTDCMEPFSSCKNCKILKKCNLLKRKNTL
jgi:hypothetical protein